jgi:hypothetical protein
MVYAALALILATAAVPASAHGNLLSIKLSGLNVSAWGNDVGRTPAADRIERRVQGNTPVRDVNSDAISCNVDGGKPSIPAAMVADVEAGSDIVYQWTNWVRPACSPVGGSSLAVRLCPQDESSRTDPELRCAMRRQRLPHV